MENKIIELFLFRKSLKFSEIEKNLSVRSNKLAYHIKNLVKKGILKKEKDSYSLTETSEGLIPYISEKRSVLPVILIHIGNKKECFLINRQKRPYKNLLSLPGGRILIGESIQQAVKRIMKEKFQIKARLAKINSVSLEHVKNQNKIIHSFLLIFVSAYASKSILTNIKNNKSKIIKSDYYLITNSLDKKISISSINSKNP